MVLVEKKVSATLLRKSAGSFPFERLNMTLFSTFMHGAVLMEFIFFLGFCVKLGKKQFIRIQSATTEVFFNMFRPSVPRSQCVYTELTLHMLHR